MNSMIVHRGPDSEGDFFKENLFLGFRRLSIIDQSMAANQPMQSSDGKLVVVYNGEIYNYVELKKELQSNGIEFKTNSDTEVLLNAYKYWGVDCVERFNGMWAFALYDFNKNILFASRDRLGIKPFYYYDKKDYIIFSSEVKAILRVEGPNNINSTTAFEYLAYGYNKSNSYQTFIEDIKELAPATNLIVRDGKIEKKKYWELTPNTSSFKIGENINDDLFLLFSNALKLRYRSDVPVGLLLSGGLDSSIIAKLTNSMILNNELSQNKLIAYTAHFPNYKFDEYNTVKKFVNELENVELRTVIPNLNKISNNIEDIIFGLDQPVQSFTSVMHYYLMEKIKEDNIKVVLNGQGADEAFYGYDRYIIGYYLWDAFLNKNEKSLKQLRAIRNKLGFSYTLIIQQLFKALITKKCASYLRSKYNEKSISILDKEFVSKNIGNFQNNYQFSIKGNNLVNYAIDHIKSTGLNSILHYEDASAMQNSIEIRSPFLDYRIMEFAFSIPDKEKFDMGVSKKILRDTLGNNLPDYIVNNYNKIGFNTPFNEYLDSKELSQFVNDMMSSTSFKTRSFWNAEKIRYIFNHKHNYPNFPFWRIINMEIWLKVNKLNNV